MEYLEIVSSAEAKKDFATRYDIFKNTTTMQQTPEPPAQST
jgi:hypothetical protein